MVLSHLGGTWERGRGDSATEGEAAGRGKPDARPRAEDAVPPAERHEDQTLAGACGEKRAAHVVTVARETHSRFGLHSCGVTLCVVSATCPWHLLGQPQDSPAS